MASEKVPLEAIDHLEFFVGNAYQAAQAASSGIPWIASAANKASSR